MLLLDGKRLVYGRAFSSNGVSYPANWLAHTSRNEHEAIGISYVDDPRPVNGWDQRWAWGYLDTGELNWKDFEMKKTELLQLNNQTAGSLLAPSDYTITRKVEKGIDIPADTSSFRDEVRRINAAREAAIEATSSTEELYQIRDFVDLPYPGSIADWKATREAAAAEATSTEETSTEETSTEETSTEATPTEATSTEVTSAEATPIEEPSTEEASAEATPAEESSESTEVTETPTDA